MYWGLFSEGKLKVETENLSCTNPNLRGDIYYYFNRSQSLPAHCPIYDIMSDKKGKYSVVDFRTSMCDTTGSHQTHFNSSHQSHDLKVFYSVIHTHTCVSLSFFLPLITDLFVKITFQNSW